MPKKSSNSAKVFFADAQRAEALLAEIVRKLTAAHPEIVKIILFGSYVRGDFVPGSDLDLLIILEHSDRPFLDRIPQYLPNRVPFPVDVFPYTEAEVRQMQAEGNPFILRALREGKVVFAKGAPVAPLPIVSAN